MKTDKYTWDLTPLYSSDDDPKIERDLKEAKEKNYQFINKWKERKDYLQDPKILREALDEYNDLEEKYGYSKGVEYYLSLRYTQDTSNKDIIRKRSKYSQSMLEIVNDLEFFELNISKIPQKKQKEFLNSKELHQYYHALERLFSLAKFSLSEKEEKILNITTKSSHSNWISMTSQFFNSKTIKVLTEKGKKKEIPISQAKKYYLSQNKKVRELASKECLKVGTELADIAEHEINSILENKRVRDRVRGYKRADEKRHLTDDISTEVVDTMLSAVEDDFSLPQKYYKLKAQLLGQKKLSYLERSLPYQKINKEYGYDEAVEVVEDVLNDLDKDFVEIFSDLKNNQRIDVFPKKGKRAGAFCAHHSKIRPVYILTNFVGSLNCVTTIAHETGHAINDYLMFKKQPEIYCDTPLSTAEVSSTFFEDFVLEKIIKNSDEETKLSILMQKIEGDIGAIHRQVACYRFEQELHERFREEGFLTKEQIAEIFKKNMVAYMGKYVSQDEGSEYFWVAWNHIRSFFYVYSYASGLLISKALQRMVREDPKNIEKVKTMLSSGSSKSAEDIFKDIGIDITKKEFWEEGLKEIEDRYNEIYTLAKKLGKI